MGYPHCSNEGHAQTVQVIRPADDLFRKVIAGIVFDVRGAISLIENGQNTGRVRRLKIIEAMLKEELID